MEQGNTAKNPKTDDKKIESIFWSIVLGSLFLSAVIVCAGLYLMANDFSELASYLICLGIAAMGSFFVYGPLRRYLKRPLWRWSVSRCTADKMTKTNKLCMWLGTSFSFASVIYITNHVAWRWILTIRGDSSIGFIPFRAPLVGLFVFLIGWCFLRIGKSTDK